jgi:hypothetical protein
MRKKRRMKKRGVSLNQKTTKRKFEDATVAGKLWKTWMKKKKQEMKEQRRSRWALIHLLL